MVAPLSVNPEQFKCQKHSPSQDCTNNTKHEKCGSTWVHVLDGSSSTEFGIF